MYVYIIYKATGICVSNTTLQSNLSYVTFQGKIEIWSHKTGGR
jgi:hypothetical protein